MKSFSLIKNAWMKGERWSIEHMKSMPLRRRKCNKVDLLTIVFGLTATISLRLCIGGLPTTTLQCGETIVRIIVWP